MAEEFCYRALDAKGEATEGVVKALSTAQVRAYLLKQGLKAVRVERRYPSPETVQKPGPVRARSFRGPSWRERLPELRLDSAFIWGMCAVLGLIGVAWMRLPALASRRPSGKNRSELRIYRVEVRGEIVGKISPSSVLTLVFPQIPYQLRKRWQQLEHPQPQQFLWKFEFRAESLATQCYLRLGKSKDSRKQQLHASPQWQTLDLGVLSAR